MDAFCQSFGELMMDGVGEFKGLEACFAWWVEPLASEGENIPDDRDPKDWKVLGDREERGGIPLSPRDSGAIAGVLFIPELSHSHHINLPSPHSTGLLSKVCW